MIKAMLRSAIVVLGAGTQGFRSQRKRESSSR